MRVIPLFACLALASVTNAQQARPNILFITTDDVGIWNLGAYSHGMMAPTPNIDRIAKEGMLFTDHYSAPSCTPGRAMMITFVPYLSATGRAQFDELFPSL